MPPPHINRILLARAATTAAPDVLSPTVLNVTASNGDGTYGTADTIGVQVIFSEPVIVTGNPRILLETGYTDRYATYASGSGTDTLLFNYTPSLFDASADLDYKATNSLELNSSTIQDAAANDATLALAAPGNPGSLGANKAIVISTVTPKLWLDAADASSITLNGSNMSQWNDKSTLAQHLVQATAANQPGYALAAENGLNVARLNGTSHWIRKTSPTALIDPAQSFTLFWAAKPTATFYPICFALPRNNGSAFIIGYEDSDASYGDIFFATGTSTEVKKIDVGSYPTGFHLVSLEYNGGGISTNANYTAKFNSGGAITPANGGGFTNVPAIISVGEVTATFNEWWGGDVGEIIYFSPGLSAGDATTVRNYLKNKWGTP